MTAGHLVAHRDLSLLCNVDPHHLVYARRQLVSVLAAEGVHIHHNARFSVRQTHGGVPDFPHLLTENGAEQSFFGSLFGFSLGRYLSDQNVPGTDFSALADHTELV